MLVVAAMVTATRLGAGAGAGVRAAEVRRPSQGPHHLGDGHNKLSMCMHTKLQILHQVVVITNYKMGKQITHQSSHEQI